MLQARRIFVLLLFFQFVLIGYSQPAQTKKKSYFFPKLEKMGFIVEMCHMKGVSENIVLAKLFGELKDKPVDSIISDPCINAYIGFQSLMDQFLMQLMIDLKAQNRPTYFNQLNRLLKKKDVASLSAKEPINKNYLQALKDLRGYYTAFLDKCNCSVTTKEDTKGGAELAPFDFVGIGTLVLDVVKAVQENNQKKVEGICAGLELMQLRSMSDLLELEEPKDKKKEDKKEGK